MTSTRICTTSRKNDIVLTRLVYILVSVFGIFPPQFTRRRRSSSGNSRLCLLTRKSCRFDFSAKHHRVQPERILSTEGLTVRRGGREKPPLSSRGEKPEAYEIHSLDCAVTHFGRSAVPSDAREISKKRYGAFHFPW